jgi:hypothetical protein
MSSTSLPTSVPLSGPLKRAIEQMRGVVKLEAEKQDNTYSGPLFFNAPEVKQELEKFIKDVWPPVVRDSSD